MILQGPSYPNRVLEGLRDLLVDPALERLRVAVAYANLDGVRALESLLLAVESHVKVEILVTLDLGITRKAALEALRERFSDSARVVVSGSGSGTFHAKAFVIDRGAEAQRALIGSANLTSAALTKNREAVSLHELSPAETEAWEGWWAEVSAVAKDLTAEVIADYTERRPPPGRRERIADEEAETGEDGVPIPPTRLPVGSANWLLIDWGGTGDYRVQSEFPKAAAAFFRPPVGQKGTKPIAIVYGDAEYVDNQLTYYPDNGMVRINLAPDLPAVVDESIKQGAALYTRLGTDRYELRLVKNAERAARLAEAACSGEVGHTIRTKDKTHRRFGWA